MYLQNFSTFYGHFFFKLFYCDINKVHDQIRNVQINFIKFKEVKRIRIFKKKLCVTTNNVLLGNELRYGKYSQEGNI